VPILLVHGWPDSVLRFTKLIPLLTAAGHDVVAPSIPGFGFSDQPRGEISPALVAEDFAWLMGELGYTRYAAHGGDWGSAIATALTGAQPEAVVALHLTDVPWDKTFSVDRQHASPAEQTFLDAAAAWAEVQTYLVANTRNPDTVAMALSDSPVGLLAWIAEMYQEWSEDPIPDDDILALASLFWLTNTVRSSMRLYSEPAQSWDDASDGDWDETAEAGAGGRDSGRVEVPTGFALFPRDLAGVPPREFAERFFPVERFTVMPRGGHFAALEQPQLLAEDLTGFLVNR
jgi:pimeloyl-ACP methyl ester carboxylesterase